MACPQKENGFIPIATEIAQVMQKIQWSNSETRIIWCVFEKTYGWHKKEDWISLSQFSKMTGLLPQHISRTITKLIKRGILKKNKNKISFNKNYEDWGLPKMVVPKQVIGVTKNGNKTLPKLVTTIDTTKDTIQKKDAFSFKTTDKQIHTDLKWKLVLLKWKQLGGRTYQGCKIVPKKDKTLWLVNQQGGWSPYIKPTFNKK